MAVTIRKATPEDADLLMRVVDMASDGVVPTLWAEMAPEGMDGTNVGRALVTAEDGEFSYANSLVAESGGAALGGLIGYPIPATPEPIGPDVPEAFVPIQELADSTPGYWYINFMAVDPEGRGKGIGTALLEEAERQARATGCPGLSLIVVASNLPAIRVYRRDGFEERGRRPFDVSGLGAEATDAVLMVKELAQSPDD